MANCSTNVGRQQPDQAHELGFNLKVCSLLPPPLDGRKQADDWDDPTPVHIALVAVQNLNTKHGFKTLSDVQVRLSLFDVAFHQFFGRTLLLPVQLPSDTRHNTAKVTVELKQDVYFMRPASSDNSTVLCLEVAGTLSAGSEVTSTSGNGRRQSLVSLGWTVIRLFDERHRGDDVQQVRLYCGTPRALLFLDEPLESLLHPVADDCWITYRVDKPKRLLKLRRLLPTNVLVSDDEAIAGSVDGVALNRQGPKMQPATPLVLDNVRISLQPSMDVSEEELCRTVEKDRFERDGPTGACTVQVSERRLRVGIHNGWCYVRPPQIAHLASGADRGHRKRHGGDHKGTPLSVTSPNLARTLSWSPSTAGQTFSEGRVLSFDRITLNDMRHDDRLLVMFSLEYVMTLTDRIGTGRLSGDNVILSPTPTYNFTVVTCQTSWRPHSKAEVDDIMCLPLIGGPVHNPECRLVYRHNEEHAGQLRLRFNWPGDRKRATSLSNLSSRTMPRPPPPDNQSDRMSSKSLGQPPNTRRPTHVQTLAMNNNPTFRGSTQTKHEPTNTSNLGEEHSSQFMTEVPCSRGPRLPIVALTTRSMLGATPVSRAAYARLYSAGLPPLLDRNGKPPNIIDPARPTPPYLSSRESGDPLRCNLITFQFLGYTDQPANWAPLRTVFFAFQFYRYPPFVTERLLLTTTEVSDLSSEPHEGATYLLRQMKPDGTAHRGPAGLEIKYCVDPIAVGSGGSVFADILNESRLHIDVWDGDSLMFVGSCVVELRDLCRQGREAVQVTYELDVLCIPAIDDDGDDISSDGVSTMPSQCGHIHLRMANVGYPYRGEGGQHDYGGITLGSAKKSLIILGTKSTEEGTTKVSVAKSMLVDILNEQNQPQFENSKEDMLEESHSRLDPEETARKLNRMNLIRMTRGDQMQSTVKGLAEQKMLDLKLVEAIRERSKPDCIQNHLHQWVGVRHRINAVLGTAEYFEFKLSNPLKTEQAVTIESEDRDLQPIVNAHEWQTFRHRHQSALRGNNREPIEERMITTGSDGWPQILLRPRETVHLPFRYQRYDSDICNRDHATDRCRHGLHHQEQVGHTISHTPMSSTRLSRVHFRGENGNVFTVLSLTVEIQLPPVDQILRFQHTENSFLKRNVRLSSHHAATAVVCTDANVTAEIRGTSDDLLLKVPCGTSGSVSAFMLFVYDDVHRLRPTQTFKVTVQAVQRIDVACVAGQATRHSVVLRGGHSTRLIRCFSSHPHELQPTSGGEPFVLEAHDRREVTLCIKSLNPGKRFVTVHAVDVEFSVLLHCWMVCVRCRPPAVSRSFLIQLPVGGGLGSNKRISYRNPYAQRRVFRLATDRPDLVQLRESAFEVDGGASHVIGLVFLPRASRGSDTVLVFIDNEDDINEETFCVKATYC